MKTTLFFVLSMVILGIILGAFTSSILTHIAIPNYSQMLLTIDEWNTITKIPPIISAINKGSFLVVVILIGMVGLSVSFLVKIFNTGFNIKSAFTTDMGIVKNVIAIIILIIGIYAIKSGVMSVPNIMLWNYIFFAILSGLFFIVFGEKGWSGSFESWEFGISGKRKDGDILFCFILGGISGALIIGIINIAGWMWWKYFILVSEVLDNSGEISTKGYELLLVSFVVIFGSGFGIIASILAGFSPSYTSIKERGIRLIPALILVFIMGILTISIYQNAAKNYDIDKKAFSIAVGIPDSSNQNKTMIILVKSDSIGNHPIIQKWSLQGEAYGILQNNRFAISNENIAKIENYINSHKTRTIYTYSAMDAIYKSHIVLLNAEKSLKAQYESAKHLLIIRMMILSRLMCVPITDENFELVKHYSDEKIYRISGRNAVSISRIYLHFGKVDLAKEWLEKAKNRGASIDDIATVKIPASSDSILIDGKIAGSIKLNGSPFTKGKIGLIYKPENTKKITEITPAILSTKLVSSSDLDSNGKFTFENLGNGAYYIVLLVDSDIIPHTIKSENITVKNNPDFINLNKFNSPTVNLDVELNM